MIIKIVSGGQTGADRAALDVAIKHKIEHGGWVPKGRIAEDGPILAKYKLQEMPMASYSKRTERNVIDSDGTLIVSHGRLTGGSAYTGKMANKHSKPLLHINLKITKAFDASMVIYNWVHENRIKILNVAGPRASKDPKIYKQVKVILEEVVLLEVGMDRLIVPKESNIQDTTRKAKRPTSVNEAIDQLMAGMKLRDLSKLAKMSEDDLIDFHFTLGMWIRSNFVYPRNDKLLESCREVSHNKNLHWVQMHMVVIKQLWKRLQETHRLKVVK